MQKRTPTYHDFMREEYSSLQKGIDFQREIYKTSMHEKDYDSAVTAIENIKIEIKKKAYQKGDTNKIIRITKICQWYRLLPLRYTTKQEYGYETIYPPDIELKIIKNLNVAYEYIMDQLNVLGYL